MGTIWFSSDPDSYVFNKLDITTDSQILVAGWTGSGGFSAAYDKNGNQTEQLMMIIHLKLKLQLIIPHHQMELDLSEKLMISG